jgi:hypothetical protein
MSVTSTNLINYKLVASGSILDVFRDEDILVSDNITGLFDIGSLPVDFSRTIILPGTKKNNAFFEHVYDISVDNPYLFSTNTKVPAYLDFDGIYLVSGYIQLNKVNILEDIGIESYEVSLFGAVSSFARDINRYFLTDLDSLAEYNHTASISNISASWHGNLHNGDIVYPLADYGTGIAFTPENDYNGIDSAGGALNVQNFKPAIRVKKVWDAVFQKFGYTYTGSFFDEGWLDDVYLVCNNALKYPEFTNIDLETYGQIKIAPFSGSNQTDFNLPVNTITQLPWYNVLNDPQAFIGFNSSYTLPVSSSLTGILNLNVNVSGSHLGAPQLELHYWETGSSPGVTYNVLPIISNFFSASFTAQYAAGNTAVNETYQVATEFRTSTLNPGTYYFGLKWSNQFSAPYNDIKLKLDPNGTPKSYLQIKSVDNAADRRIMDIPSNMPYGTAGIKLVDFIKGIQKKFNLVIYPNKTKPTEFIVETFNNWYKRGVRKDFNKYINLNTNISVVPANNLAVNKLTFGDTLDQDYISQQFAKGQNRNFGTSYYIDTENFFSQGELKVESGFGVSPLTKIPGTGISGSVGGFNPPPSCARYLFGPAIASGWVNWTNCDGSSGQSYVNMGSTYYVNCAKIGTVTGIGPVVYITSCG